MYLTNRLKFFTIGPCLGDPRRKALTEPGIYSEKVLTHAPLSLRTSVNGMSNKQ